MFDIYIKNFNRNGSLVQTETLIQTIPAASEGGLRLISPQIKNEMGNAESFDFSIEPNTPYYDAFLQMKTMIRVEYDGDNIFFGRVLTVENNRFSGLRKIRCEGAISLLMDSPVKGVKEANRSKVSTFTYICGLIESHNAYLKDPDKHFDVGQVPGNYAGVNSDQQLDSDTRKFGADSWSDTKTALEDLRSHFGGYFRTRTSKIGNGIYLDWLDNYFNPTTNAQTIEVSKNILDISDITEVDNIFTVLVPLGTYQNTSNSSDSSSSSSSSSTTDNTMYIDGTYLPVPKILDEFSGSELSRGYHKPDDYRNAIDRYGAIFKTVQFSNATSKSDLRNKACEWIKDNYYGEIVKYTIKAIDLHQIGEDVPKILVGDLVRLVYPVIKEDGTDDREDKTRTCMSATYDLYHPENNSYTFGIPANILTSMYGISNTSSVSSNSTSSGGNGGEAEDDEGTPWGKISNWLMNHRMYYDWEQWGSDYFPWTTEFYGDDLDHMHGPSGNNDKEYMFNPGQYIYRFSYSIDSEYDARLYKQILSQDGMLSALSYKSAHCHWSYAKDTSIRYMEESNYIDILNDYNIREYVMMEYGFDLLAWASVSGLVAMGNTIVSAVIQGFTDTAGNTIKRVAFGSSILTGMFGDAENNPFTKLFAFTDDPFEFNQKPVVAVSNVANGLGETFSNSLIQFFGNLNSNQPTSWVDHDGTLHWYYEDPKSPGTYVETTNRSLNLKAVNSDNFIGTMVTQDYADADGNIHTYKFGQGIEEWAHGELVVAHVEGDATYIGGRDSMYTAMTSLQHMDNICGDFTYETDEDGIQYVNINSAGGMRITSAKKDDAGNPIVGPDGKYITAEFGVFDDNTLKGGIIVDKLNNDKYTTKITGTKVDIQADQMASIGIWTNDKFDAGVIIDRINEGVNADGKLIPSTRIQLSADQVIAGSINNLSDWLSSRGEKIDETSGLLAEKITAYEARFSKIESDYVKTKFLNAEIGAIPLLNVQDIATTIPKGQANFNSYYGNHFYLNVPGGAGSVTYKDLIDNIDYVYFTSSGATTTVHLHKASGSEVDSSTLNLPTGGSLTFKNYTGGWDAAVGKLTIPTSQVTNNNTILIKYPPSTVDGAALSRSYYINNTSGDNNKVDLVTSVNNQEVTVARYSHGKYTGGWNAAVGKLTIPTSQVTNNNTILIKYPPSTVDGAALSRSYYINNTSGDNNKVDLVTSVNNQEVTVARYSHGKYTGGWNAAVGKLTIPTSTVTNNNAIIVKYPPSTVDGSPASRSYYMSNTSGDNNKVDLITSVNNQEVTVARYSHGKYNSGWGAAVGKLTIPTSQVTNNNTIIVKYPPSTVGGSADSRSYYMSNTSGDNNRVDLVTKVNNQEVTVARFYHGKYTAGHNDGWTEGYAEGLSEGDHYDHELTITRAGWHSTMGNIYKGKLYYWDDDDESYQPVVDDNYYWYYSSSSKSGTTTVYY